MNLYLLFLTEIGVKEGRTPITYNGGFMMTLKGFLTDIEEYEKTLICFGTGLMAEEALQYPAIRHAVRCFCDNDKEKQGETIRIGDPASSYEVIAPDQIKSRLDGKTVLLITSGHFKEIEAQLSKLQLPESCGIYTFPVMKVNLDPKSEDFFEERILKECLKEYDVILDQYGIFGDERMQSRKEKEAYIRGEGRENRPFVIPRTMLMPTTRCNLRCKGCSSLLPLFEHPQDIDVNQILKDCDIFFSGIDECIRLTVGGEPFLYPKLDVILEHLIAEPKLLGIMLITNGMKVPDASLIPLLQDRKVFLEISDYGRLEQMSRTVAFMEKNHVNFTVLTEQVWTDMGGIEKRGRSEEELRFIYMNCDQGRVIKGMHNGRFHTCARSSRMLSLGAYESDSDYFELSENDSPEEIRQKLCRMYYSDHADACDHCDLGMLPARVMEAGIQMNGHIKKSGYTIVDRLEYERLKKLSIIAGESWRKNNNM